MLAFLIQYDKILFIKCGEYEMKAKPTDKKRIFFLDELRGIAVFCMIFYHAFYMLGTMFGYEWAKKLFVFFAPAQPFFAGLFILICGVSCSLSKSNLKRGAKLLGAAAVVTFFTAFIMPLFGFIECEIYFGILHLLSVCILISTLLEKPFGRIPPFAGLLVCAVLYPFTSGISSGMLSYGDLLLFKIPEVLYESDWLVPIGISSPSFFSADYFPLLPWMFIFFAGVFVGRYFRAAGFPEWAYPQRIKLFGFLGRNALIIYIAHMPLIYVVSELIGLVSKFFAA